jgi:hypothetical protein
LISFISRTNSGRKKYMEGEMLTKTTLVKLRRNVMVSLSRLFVRRTREKLEGSKVW